MSLKLHIFDIRIWLQHFSPLFSSSSPPKYPSHHFFKFMVSARPHSQRIISYRPPTSLCLFVLATNTKGSLLHGSQLYTAAREGGGQSSLSLTSSNSNSSVSTLALQQAIHQGQCPHSSVPWRLHKSTSQTQLPSHLCTLLAPRLLTHPHAFLSSPNVQELDYSLKMMTSMEQNEFTINMS